MNSCTREEMIERAVCALTAVARGMHVNDTKSRRQQDAEAVVDAILPTTIISDQDIVNEFASMINHPSGGLKALNAYIRDLRLAAIRQAKS